MVILLGLFVVSALFIEAESLVASRRYLPRFSPSRSISKEWEVLRGSDAFTGAHAFQVPAERGLTVDELRALCVERGCGGFVLFAGGAYFKAPTGPELLRAANARPSCELHAFLGTPIRPPPAPGSAEGVEGAEGAESNGAAPSATVAEYFLGKPGEFDRDLRRAGVRPRRFFFQVGGATREG